MTFNKSFEHRRKRRSSWFRERTVWPRREALATRLLAARRAAGRMQAAQVPTPARANLGPTNVGGRMTSALVHPSDAGKIWAGSAGGGVWFSRDGGETWRPQWARQRSLSIGSMCMDPNDPDVIYCATGEANLQDDHYPGAGIYRTLNGGRTWRLWADGEAQRLPTRIGALAVHPADSTRLWLGGLSFGEGDRGGLYSSTDSGRRWRRQPNFISERGYWCHSIVFDHSNPSTLFVTVTEEGANTGIWKSTDDGASWISLTDDWGTANALPFPQDLGRIRLAVAPTNASVLYAMAEVWGGYARVFYSANSGASWEDISGNHFDNELQMSYNNAIAVHPQDENRVICGGVDLHLTTDRGQRWSKVTEWRARRGDPRYAHADHHEIVIPAADPKRIYDFNDGGMDYSNDGGVTWENRSDDLDTLMYYDVAVAPSDPDRFGGGTQDNGTLMTVSGKADEHFEILGGDGGWIAIDPGEADDFYASIYKMQITRFRDFDPVEIFPGEAAERESVWMAFLALDPQEPQRLFTGSHRVWKTLTESERKQKDTDAFWEPISPQLDGSLITAIEVAPQNPDHVYVGTEWGGFFRSLDGGETWSSQLKGSVLPGRTITRIKSDPRDADIVYLTVGNFGNSHVFRSGNGGLTWQDVDGGKLPDAPHHSLEIRLDPPHWLFVATDVGVFVSQDEGGSWHSLSFDLPHVNCIDVVHHRQEDTLTLATYGRGLWRLKLS